MDSVTLHCREMQSRNMKKTARMRVDSVMFVQVFLNVEETVPAIKIKELLYFVRSTLSSLLPLNASLFRNIN